MMATQEEITAFLAKDFPQARCVVDDVGARRATVSLEVGVADLRPGGTVSGPVLMEVADMALYIALLGEIGIVPLAVTTSLTINFLRKPTAGKRIVGECKLLKVGKSLVIGEQTNKTDGTTEPVAHAAGTYLIPPWP